MFFARPGPGAHRSIAEGAPARPGIGPGRLFLGSLCPWWLCALLAHLLLGSSAARAEALVLWVAGPVPGEITIERTEQMVGPALHLPGNRIAFVPREPDSSAAEAQQALVTAIDDCLARWEAFDVERAIAWQLDEAISRVEILQDSLQRESMLQALLLEGAALHWAYPPGKIDEAPEAAPMLRDLGPDLGKQAAPWLDAIALADGQEIPRTALPDTASFQAFMALKMSLASLEPAYLDIALLPGKARLFVDGVERPHSRDTLPLFPGRHWVHLLLDGKIAGSGVLTATSGQNLEIPSDIPMERRQQAGQAILDGRPEAIPTPVQQSVQWLAQAYPGQTIYLATIKNRGRPVLMSPDGQYQATWRPKLWTALLTLDAGPGIAASESFDLNDDSTTRTVGDMALGTSFEMAYSLLALVSRVELQVSPGGDLLYGQVSTGTNKTTNTWLRLGLGPGIYLKSPHAGRSHLLASFQLGGLIPGHTGWGLQAVGGLPIKGKRWFRVSLDFWTGTPTSAFQPYYGEKLNQLGLRLGLAQGFK